MAWVKIKNNIVVQKQPYKEDGFVQVDDSVICGQEKQSDGTFKDKVVSFTYKEERMNNYPSMQDQLDDIYHNGIDGWKKTIKTIKDKYPKE